MKKAILVLLMSVFLIGSIPFKAQATTTEMPNLTMRCVDATNIGTSKSQHFVKIDGTGFEPNKPIELWRNTTEGFVCATDAKGESLCNSHTVSAGDKGRDFQILNITKEQVVADANGEIHLAKVRSRTKARLTHQFYGAQKTAATLTTTELPEMTAQEYGLKLLTFLKLQEQTAPSGSTNCATVFFDPYGRVFDSVSLEPIPNVNVWLLDANKNNVPNRPGVINPNLTLNDGAFSFFVDPGTYFLNPQVNGYTYPISEAEISALSTNQSIYTDLYRGEPIIQLEEIEHRDVPMNPIDPSNPTNTQPVIIDQEIAPVLENGVDYQSITGITSHPKSNIYVYSGTRLVGSTTANNQGEFSLLIDNSLIDQTVSLDLIAEKVTLTKSQIIGSTSWLKQFKTFFIKDVRAESLIQSKKVSLQPRPSYLIGFIFDNNRQIAPLTEVEIVIPQMENRVFATLKTDSQGFLFIPYQSLPPVEYILRYKLANTIEETQTLNEFINNNKDFLNEEKVNLFDPQTTHVASVAAAVRAQGAKFNEKYQPPAQPTLKSKPTPTTSDQGNIFVILTFLVIIAIGALIVVLRRFKEDYKNKSDSSL